MSPANDATETGNAAGRPHAAPAGSYLYYRHTLPVRVMHWINVVALTILFMSGLQIFNAHPALYWGKSSYDGTPPRARRSARAQDAQRRGHRRHARLRPRVRHDRRAGRRRRPPMASAVRAAFPSWMTIPGMQWLSMARAWHFFFAWVFVLNGIAFVVYAIVEPPSRARSGADAAPTCAASARRSATTCASGIRPARRPSATTCCRSSPTSS